VHLSLVPGALRHRVSCARPAGPRSKPAPRQRTCLQRCWSLQQRTCGPTSTRARCASGLSAAPGSAPAPPQTSPVQRASSALRSAARRWQHLSDEITKLDTAIASITATTARDLLDQVGVGPNVAAALLIAAGENTNRLRDEASFASLCAVNPLPVSSGKTRRHRLNRGGDRQANAALHTVAVTRGRFDPRTHDYVVRRTAQGLSKREIMRCLKRYIARDLYPRILASQAD
jgi:transposase